MFNSLLKIDAKIRLEGESCPNIRLKHVVNDVFVQ